MTPIPTIIMLPTTFPIPRTIHLGDSSTKDLMTRMNGRLAAVFEREYMTVRRTRVYGFVGLGFTALVLALALVGGVSGYISVVLNLLTPLEVLLPVLGAAFGYRALLADRASGELQILRTFPLSRRTYVSGILLGRLLVMLVVVLVPLVLVGLAVPLLTGGSSEFLLRRTTYNGPILFVRFCVLTATAAVVFFTTLAAVSAAAADSRRAIALAVLSVVGLAIGLDIAIIAGIATDLVAPELLPWVLAVSPVSAYRGLVLALVVEPATAGSLQSGSVVANLLGLTVWLLGTVAVSFRLAWD